MRFDPDAHAHAHAHAHSIRPTIANGERVSLGHAGPVAVCIGRAVPRALALTVELALTVDPAHRFAIGTTDLQLGGRRIWPERDLGELLL